MSESMWSGPFFDPPYDSPIEDEFARHVVKYLRDAVVFDKQMEVRTILGTFRVDFVLTLEGRRVGIECDGREFHDRWRDEVRDAMIFGANGLDVMYRIRGCDIVYHLEDVLHILAHWEAPLFTDRARINLAHLATPRLAAYVHEEPWFGVMTGLPDGGTFDLDRSDRVPPEGKRVHWPSIYRRAQGFVESGGTGGVDALIAYLSEQHQLRRLANRRLLSA